MQFNAKLYLLFGIIITIEEMLYMMSKMYILSNQQLYLKMSVLNACYFGALKNYLFLLKLYIGNIFSKRINASGIFQSTFRYITFGISLFIFYNRHENNVC